MVSLRFTATSLACAVGVTTARADKDFSSTVQGSQDQPEELAEDRNTTIVHKRDMDRRLPRSAPDALRYEPGVFVQQTAHGQGSPFIRGLTGQQTLMLFDGIRMNNSVYRQGPNQYFFTLDARTIQSIEVLRGGGSTLWGSDALGGVIDAHPIEPTLDGGAGATRQEPGASTSAAAPTRAGAFQVDPRVIFRVTTADSERGGRAQLDIYGAGPRGLAWGFFGGVGGRYVGLLNGPPVLNPDRDPDTVANKRIRALPPVPAYQGYNPLAPIDGQLPNLRIQLGTGFQELSLDGRLVLVPDPSNRVTLAAYAYRQFNTPRTDQCPPPSAPETQCFTYEEQFRTLVYGAWQSDLGAAARSLRVTLSWQEQHERKRLDLTAAEQIAHGFDDVETFGVTARARTARFAPLRWLALRVDYGLDTYFDWVRSKADHIYTDTREYVVESRGQYVDGATYLYGGVHGDLLAELGRYVRLHGGARVSWIAANAGGDRDSGTAPVHRAWFPVVGHAGVEVRPVAPLSFLVNYDNSYRAPNLDDMTSRQQTGPGFQFENPDLRPERAHTFEVGARLRHRFVVADVWGFETLIEDPIIKVNKLFDDCPVNTPQCGGSWSRFKLENAPRFSELRGIEGAAKVFFPLRIALRATVAYVWSEGEKVGVLPKGVQLKDEPPQRVPLSRTPPLNGTVELSWSHASGVSASAALQWAGEQNRLALADYADGRIPKYGTPEFAVVQLRASYRFHRSFLLSAIVENLFDSPYRYHGSSVNGAGRGVIVQLEAAPFI